MSKFLIATTNEGKFREIKHFLSDLPFEIVSLKDLDQDVPEPEEDQPTIEGNAILKAKYYAEKTGLISLADDGGLFISALDGWPGVSSARIGKTVKERNEKTLEKLRDKKERKAEFKAALAVYNPETQDLHITHGVTKGNILENEVDAENGFGYDPIFHVTEKGKTYAEMTTGEKNSCSHRGKALTKMKYFIQNQYGARHIVVPFGVVIRDGKMLITKRNDPQRPDFHEKWEMPGGIMEFGVTMEENVVREIKEETGYDVEVIERLNHVYIKEQVYPTWKYQVYLIPFVCKIVGGEESLSDAEVLEAKWIGADEYDKFKFLDKTDEMIEEIIPDIKKSIEKYKL